MLNYLWAGMILAGVLYGIFTGNIEAVSDGLLSGGGEAVSLCITMAGVVTLWTGVMNIAEQSGLIAAIRSKMGFIIRGLFPKLPSGHPAGEYISINLISNFLGLGWAATPAGLRAMEELAALEEERTGGHSDVASDEMCTFLVVNISSIQLIPVTVIAYRIKYGSVAPTAIVLPAIIATVISTFAGVVFCKIMCKIRTGKNKG